jgi:hypothetical protein
MRKIPRLGIALALTSLLVVLGLGAASASGTAEPPHNGPDGPVAGNDVSAQAVIDPAKMNDLFVPLTPCRVLDTRLGGGQILGGTIRNVYVSGTFGFQPQGGTTGGCGVPLGATAVAATVLSVNSTATGRITAYPSAAAAPTATTLYFSKGVTTSTGTTLSLTTGAAKQLAIKSYATTDVVIDVSGYYIPQIHAALASGGGVYAGSPRVLSSTRLGTGSYRVQLDIDPAGCTPVASILGGAYIASAYVSGGYIYANTYTVAGVATDLYWTLDVLC